MMIQAVLGNPHHPEYGVATIPFPIPHDQYAHCMELLEALEIGDAVKADCQVQEINSFYSVLKRTEMLTVNVEELNYLAKRLDSFDTGEAAQFQAMAHKLELFELKDLINLTFCCQQATVITDFSDLSAVGRDHYMNLHGGSAKTEQLDALDGEETARRLIESGSGTITPYGVVYDNGMKLEQVYDGRFFPCYYYEPNAITVAVTSKAEPEDTEHITWLFLPMVQEEIDRALQRAGIADPADVRLRLEDKKEVKMMENMSRFHIRPARPDEAGLFYTPHPEEDKRRGTIGHIRMDFGRSGNEFWHTWWPRGPEELNSPAFKAELQEVVDTMREDVLKSRFAMERFCYDHGGKITGGYVQNYGYIVETEHYRYCLRCNPSPGDYNGYLTAYDLDVQRQNMAQEKSLVGRVTYANGDAQDFTDTEAFLKCMQEELPYRPTTGFRYEVLTDDPTVRTAVDDIVFDLYGEENPRQQEDYELQPSPNMTLGGM